MAKKIRCSFCNKKIGLINFTCKCEGVFCSLHRYVHTHECTYKEEKILEKKEEIKVLNPKVESSKLDEI